MQIIRLRGDVPAGCVRRRKRWKPELIGKRRTAEWLEHCFHDALLGCIPYGAALYYLSGSQQHWTAGEQRDKRDNTNWPFLHWHLLTLEKWSQVAHTDAQLMQQLQVNEWSCRSLRIKHTNHGHISPWDKHKRSLVEIYQQVGVFMPVCAAGRSWEEKDYLWTWVDEPQAQFQRTTSNLGHRPHKTSGQEQPLGLLFGLINMEGGKLHIYCMHNLLAFLISLSNVP